MYNKGLLVETNWMTYIFNHSFWIYSSTNNNIYISLILTLGWVDKWNTNVKRDQHNFVLYWNTWGGDAEQLLSRVKTFEMIEKLFLVRYGQGDMNNWKCWTHFKWLQRPFNMPSQKDESHKVHSWQESKYLWSNKHGMHVWMEINIYSLFASQECDNYTSLKWVTSLLIIISSFLNQVKKCWEIYNAKVGNQVFEMHRKCYIYKEINREEIKIYQN